MILEGVVTTLGSAGVLNIAPMGPWIDPELDMSRFELRPYRGSTTFRNLAETGEGVFHITDDVLLIAQTAIDLAPAPAPITQPAACVRGRILADACRYFEFRVVERDLASERARFLVETVHEGRIRDFLGFNRARHAVLEAAILATRVALLPLETIIKDLEPLAVIVRKTGGPREHTAFELLREHIQEAARKSAAEIDPAGDRP